MNEEQETFVHKITLSSGKVVLMREIELGDEEFAANASGKKSGDSSMTMGYNMINELLKLVIVEIDGHRLTANDRLVLKNFLTYKEIVQCRKVLEKIMGETEAEATVEFVPSGQQ